MNTNLNLHTESSLAEMSTKEIAAIYNEFATELNVKLVARFANKTTCIARTLTLQCEYVQALPVVEKVVAKDTTRQTRFDMDLIVTTVKDESKEGTIENSLHAAIASGCATAGEIVDCLVSTHKRPRSGLGVDEQYVVHNIKWFVKKGHLKLVQSTEQEIVEEATEQEIVEEATEQEIVEEATEQEIRQAIAESGKTRVKDMMSYLNRTMKKHYDLELASKNAKELAKEMKSYL